MKITDVILPKIINYYVSDNCMQKIKDTLLFGSNVYQEKNDLHVTTENDFDAFDALKLIKSKSERITLGEQMKFEYEMDISMPNGHLFQFKLDDGREINCSLNIVHILDNNDIKLVFKIIK